MTDISDHFPTICNVVGYRKLEVFTPIFIRDKTNFNPDKFNQNLETALNDYMAKFDNITEENFDNITKENFDICFSSFVTVVKDIIDKHAPYKPLTRKQKKLHHKPWITNGILTSIKHKKRIFKTHYLSNDQTKKLYYKNTRTN